MSDEAKTFEKKITDLGDSIVKLSLKEAKDLGDYLEDEYGIEPAGGGAVVMAAGGDGGGEAAAEQTSFDAILKDVGSNKIQVIKAVREITGLGLKEAKDVVDSAPKPIKEGVSKEDAEEIKEKLSATGATVEIV